VSGFVQSQVHSSGVERALIILDRSVSMWPRRPP
jgi:hypothetical protein